MTLGWGVDRDSAGTGSGSSSGGGSSGSGGVLIGVHSSLTGLVAPADDHTQYLLASQATDRSTFTTNWALLTGSAATTLHTHAHSIITGASSGDDHTQYVLLAGRSGGQSLKGGTGAAELLTLNGTSQAAGGDVVIGGGTSASALRFMEPSGSGTNYSAFKAQAQSGNVTYTLPAADAAVSGYALKSDGAGTLTWGQAGGADLKQTITQSSHGFSVGNWLYYTGSTYALAKADAAGTAECVGVVASVIDANNFQLQQAGYITTLSGLTAGGVHFLSASSAGAVTTTEPSTVGQISKPLIIADSTTTGWVVAAMRGAYVGSPSSTLAVNTYSGDNSTVNFTLAQTPGHVNNCFVSISGVLQQKSTYTVSGTTLTFTTAPPSGTSNIEVVVVGSVAIGTASAVSTALGTTLYSGGKNAVINGAFEVWQMGTSFAAATTYQAPDCWKFANNCDAVATISRQSDVPTVAQAGILAPYSMKLAVTTADTSIAAGQYCVVQNIIEGYVWRNFAQRSLTLTFWVKAHRTGTYCIYLSNSGSDRIWTGEYTVNVADTWEKKTLQISASPSAGTWDYTTGQGVALSFTLAAGSTYNIGANNTWNTTVALSTANQINGVAATSDTFQLALVQLEVGDTATDFAYVPFVDEIARCKRYYQKTFSYATAPAQNTNDFSGALITDFAYANSAGCVAQWAFATEMRISPTMTTYNPHAANANFRNTADAADATATLIISFNTRGGAYYTSAGSVSGFAYCLHVTADARL